MSGFNQFKALMEMLKIRFDNPLITRILYDSAIKIDKGETITLMDIAEDMKLLHDDFEKKITVLKEEFTEKQINLIVKTFKDETN